VHSSGNVWRKLVVLGAVALVGVVGVCAATPSSLSEVSLAAYRASANPLCVKKCENGTGPECVSVVTPTFCKATVNYLEKVKCVNCDRQLFDYTVTSCSGSLNAHKQNSGDKMAANTGPEVPPPSDWVTLDIFCDKVQSGPCSTGIGVTVCPGCEYINFFMACVVLPADLTETSVNGNTRCK